MKTTCLLSVLFAVARLGALGQGFVYDQQSSASESTVIGGGSIQSAAPIGQSFTPTFSSLNFIRLSLFDINPAFGSGAALYLNLREDTVGGPILATTPTVYLNNGFSGFVNFFFDTDVLLSSGSIYAFEIVVAPGSDNWGASAKEYLYPGGTAFYQGSPLTGSDLWFREGIYTVPEPSVTATALLGAGALWWLRHKKQ